MSIIEASILGLVQGLTEFLPVSSSGHLVIIRHFFGFSLENTLSFDVLLHLATLFAILICFKGDIKRIFTDFKTEGFSSKSSNLLWAIVVGTIPAIIFGYFFADTIEETFRNPIYIAYALIAGSILFFIADRLSSGRGGITILKGFVIGLFQSLAFISGFSRSGSTISGGLIVGLSREESIKFSFLLGIPIIFGAGLKTFMELSKTGDLIELFRLESMISFVIALFSGIWAVKFLVRYLSKNSFTIFIIYRLILATSILFLV